MEQKTQSNYKEILGIIIAFALVLTLLKIVFYQETIFTILKITTAIFWLFVMPTYFITSIWKEQIRLVERFAIGIPISAAILGILSYYLGLAGLNLEIQTWLLAPIISFFAFIIQKKDEPLIKYLKH